MSSITEQLVVAAITALNTNRPGGVPEFERARTIDLANEDLPVAIVYSPDERSEPVHKHHPLAKREMALVIEYFFAGTETVSADSASDATKVWIVKALVGSPTRLGGLATAIVEGNTERNLAQADRMYCLASTEILIETQSQRTNPEVFA